MVGKDQHKVETMVGNDLHKVETRDMGWRRLLTSVGTVGCENSDLIEIFLKMEYFGTIYKSMYT